MLLLSKPFFYPPDPSSLKWCTIGGNIACNAGGLRCVKYGVTRDYVVALEVFCPLENRFNLVVISRNSHLVIISETFGLGAKACLVLLPELP